MATRVEVSSSRVLPRSPLGRTSMRITRIGFGAWAVRGPDWAVGWGPQDDKTSIAAIRHAVERGIPRRAVSEFPTSPGSATR